MYGCTPGIDPNDPDDDPQRWEADTSLKSVNLFDHILIAPWYLLKTA